MATINTDATAVKGVIIFPDNYAGGTPEGVSWRGAGTTCVINAGSDYVTTCTTAGWAALEAAGCIFLPAAGMRDKSSGYNRVADVNSIGHYWSKTPAGSDGTSAYYLEFYSTSFTSKQSGRREYGYSVRLVHDVN